jgi:stearoyl-CoA desaturase (delta-9 desaturase)
MHLLHNVGLHRYFAHNSFKTSKLWHAVLSVTTPLACAGSPYGYAMAHRAHHIFSDTEKDPHYKDLGILNISFFRWNLKNVPLKVMASLNEKWILIGHNYYVLIILITYMFLVTLDFRLGLLYNVSIFFLWLGYLTINVIDHRAISFGYRNFDTNDKSKNDLFTGYIVGEWHNNHHHNPQAWNQRVHWWEFDFSAQIIKLIKL